MPSSRNRRHLVLQNLVVLAAGARRAGSDRFGDPTEPPTHLPAAEARRHDPSVGLLTRRRRPRDPPPGLELARPDTPWSGRPSGDVHDLRSWFLFPSAPFSLQLPGESGVRDRRPTDHRRRGCHAVPRGSPVGPGNWGSSDPERSARIAGSREGRAGATHAASNVIPRGRAPGTLTSATRRRALRVVNGSMRIGRSEASRSASRLWRTTRANLGAERRGPVDRSVGSRGCPTVPGRPADPDRSWRPARCRER